MGGRRCPSCDSYKAAAKANANRRYGRNARRKVVDHLRELGMVDTAAAVLSLPPSMLPELMQALEIDQSVLGDTPMPSTHANPPSAKLIIAQAKTEREKLAGPQITPAQAALDAAHEHVESVDLEADGARKAVNRQRVRLRKAKNAVADGTGSSAAVVEQQQLLDDAKQAYLDAQRHQRDAQDDLAAAKYGMRVDLATDDERDAYYANLTEDEIAAIGRSLNRTHGGEAVAALNEGPPLSLSSVARDKAVYHSGTIPMETGSGINDVQGRLLDGGTAIYRRGSGDFLILQRNGDAYFPVAQAHSKSHALDKANRIPIVTGLETLPAGASDLQRHAHSIKSGLALELAGKAAEGVAPTPSTQQNLLDDGIEAARTKIADSAGAGPMRVDVYEGTKRHKKALREKAAMAAGEKARTEALATGASKIEASAAYAAAHRRALGTPTRGGGVIPHFDHDIPPGSLGPEKYASLTRSGVRAFGNETAGDYAVIAQRGGNLKAWGFTNSAGQLKTSNITDLTGSNTAFVKNVLTASERNALTTYTGGTYQQINAAITGRNPNPSSHIKTVVGGLESAFDKFGEHNPNMTPMTLMRGTRVPSGWKGTTSEYISAAFTVGSRVQIGKVTSCSTNPGTASAFAGHPPYMMVVRTRQGLPVKSISHFSGENEVVLPPGTDLRCVKVDHHGVGGIPTVYLVAEDLVAEAEGSPMSSAA
ncbi:ADP-ribosyltransferase [Aldersonia sp. NBC_00410]|uniref:ADP-ribosyltransferase n=1 Tax=Aldersonia sp. NBC_00410 TaxID=2975954 RepID=UPI002258C3D1|nr:ADP-ribosyltransferase [Aldersonia sp. NBC_00410]MCX5046712.1 ADP-ribosyltransferase [Aldersonia sp. NBC_00410]